MKTRFFFSLAAVAVLSFGGQSLNAQYPGQFAPGYGYQVPGGMVPMGQQAVMPGMMPGSPIVPAGFAQPSPFGAPAAFIPASPATAPLSQVIPAGYQADCSGKGCDGCDSCSKGGKGGPDHAWEFYGEFLYLRARDAEVAYAVPFNGPVRPAPANSPVQVGPVGVLDMDYQPAFRVGASKIIDDCTRISAEYMNYNSTTLDQTVRGGNPAYVVHSLVSHPSTATAAQNFIQADGRYSILMNMLDVDMRKLFYNDCDLKIGWVLGVRAAQQKQQLRVDFAGNGTETVATNVDFNGVGVKFGLDGEARVAGQWLAYANCGGSVMPSLVSAGYDQSQSYDPVVVNTNWKAGRIVTIWDLELGVSRVSRCGNYRVNAGYMFMAWTNMLQTDQWIESVQGNNFIGRDSTMTFDGLVARFEGRY
ncbi:MAG: Lpg1974 family pore-forming outer membrane protein [Planctomycetota bacterium]